MKDYERRRLESIGYIQQMLGELRTLAEIERCDMLTYLIEMAYIEAGEIRRGVRPMRVQDARREEARRDEARRELERGYETAPVPLKAAG